MLPGLIKLPMTYHMCTGTLPPDTYWSRLTEKCDEDNNSLEIATSVVYLVIFLLFGSAVVYESLKGNAHARQQIDPSCNIQVNIVIRPCVAFLTPYVTLTTLIYSARWV